MRKRVISQMKDELREISKVVLTVLVGLELTDLITERPFHNACRLVDKLSTDCFEALKIVGCSFAETSEHRDQEVSSSADPIKEELKGVFVFSQLSKEECSETGGDLLASVEPIQVSDLQRYHLVVSTPEGSGLEDRVD